MLDNHEHKVSDFDENFPDAKLLSRKVLTIYGSTVVSRVPIAYVISTANITLKLVAYSFKIL